MDTCDAVEEDRDADLADDLYTYHRVDGDNNPEAADAEEVVRSPCRLVLVWMDY